MKLISYGRQSISQEDINEVSLVLGSDFLTQGPKVSEFEEALCSYTGATYCVAVANGTAALHIAVASLKIARDSEGITSPITFAASANCMLYNNLVPRFADIDEQSYNIDVKSIRKLLNEKSKLMIPVHFAGLPVDMETVAELAKEKNLHVIEDAAHAIGSQYADGSFVGNCKYSDMTIFSFHPVKTITTGEGGAITTNSKILYDRLIKLRSHGITKDQHALSSNPGPWYYEMQDLGFNYRLTDFQAALGISQLQRLDSFKQRRREIISRYNQAFKKISWLSIPKEPTELNSCFHLYVLLIDFKALGKSRRVVMNELLVMQVGTQVHYIPVNHLPYYKKINDDVTPYAESYYEKCLSIPLYPAMSDADVGYVIDSIIELAQ
jgi:perosamine synthetase